MFKEQIYKDYIEKIPNNAKLVMFGTCEVAVKMIEDIKHYKPNCKILGFIDNYKKEIKNFLNLPLWTLNEFIELNLDYDYVVMSTREQFGILNNIFKIYNVPVIYQTDFMHRYYRNCFDKLGKLNDENFKNVINIFKNQDDKDLYEFIFRVRCANINSRELSNIYERYNLPLGSWAPIEYQYLEKINKDAITKIIDAGLYNGLNEVAFNKMLPNLEYIYGFEVLYDRVKLSFIDNIIKHKLKVIPYCLGEKEDSVNFWINKINPDSSFCMELTDNTTPKDITRFEKLKVPVTTINKYCRENNIKYDFLKMDIEGAELPALKGGLETIKEFRPQLAISIYHSTSDFVDIPQFLNNNLINYTFKIGHYSYNLPETVLYAIPDELT